MRAVGRAARAAAARLGPAGVAGLAALAFVALACVLGPVLSPYGVREIDLTARNQGPGWSHPFGTGDLGEDVLTRVLAAGRVSLVIGLATAAVATTVGAGLGLAAGWWRGPVDAALSRITDLVLIVPAFVVLIVLSLSFSDVGVPQVVLILSLLSWPPLFRLTRASALRTARTPYVEAAEAAGAGGARIVTRHLLPAATPEIASFAALAVGTAILSESALSFLSLGLDPENTLSWGGLMIGAPDTIEERPWLTVFPGVMIVVTVVAVSLVGDAVRRSLEPRDEATARRVRPW